MLRRTVFLCMGLVTVLCSVPGRAAEPLVFDLSWEASTPGCSINSNLKPDVQEPFAQEPDFAGREVLRGLLPCAQDAEQHLAYIWDIEQKRLYVDKNHNRDLTDDPSGIYESADQDIRYQSFRDVEIEVPRGTQVYAYRLSLRFNRYNPPRVYCHATVQSGFQAQIELAGQAYRVQMVDNLDGQLDRSDRLHVSLVKPGSRIATAHLYMPPGLYLDGRLYNCEYAWVTDERQPKARLTLTEQAPPLGQLTIAGQGIEYLELKALQAQHAVPIFEPNQMPLSIPVGTYGCYALHLKRQGRQQMHVDRLDQRVTIETDAPATLKLGGPLKSTLKVERANKSLVLSFKMVGQGGEEYRTLGTRDTQPYFTVYKGDREIHSDKFEYG